VLVLKKSRENFKTCLLIIAASISVVDVKPNDYFILFTGSLVPYVVSNKNCLLDFVFKPILCSLSLFSQRFLV